jgi:hypothetical protein
MVVIGVPRGLPGDAVRIRPQTVDAASRRILQAAGRRFYDLDTFKSVIAGNRSPSRKSRQIVTAVSSPAPCGAGFLAQALPSRAKIRELELKVYEKRPVAPNSGRRPWNLSG